MICRDDGIAAQALFCTHFTVALLPRRKGRSIRRVLSSICMSVNNASLKIKIGSRRMWRIPTLKQRWQLLEFAFFRISENRSSVQSRKGRRRVKSHPTDLISQMCVLTQTKLSFQETRLRDHFSIYETCTFLRGVPELGCSSGSVKPRKMNYRRSSS